MALLRGAAMVVEVLTEADRRKIDRSDDALFYAEPRFVQHLDGGLSQLASPSSIGSAFKPGVRAARFDG